DFLTEKFESISSRHVFFGSDIVLPAAEPAAHVGRRSHRDGGRQTECQSQEPAIRFTRIRHSPNSDADAPIRVRPEGVSPARACSAPLLGIPGIIVAVVAVAETPLLTSRRRAAASTFFACDAREARGCGVCAPACVCLTSVRPTRLLGPRRGGRGLTPHDRWACPAPPPHPPTRRGLRNAAG